MVQGLGRSGGSIMTKSQRLARLKAAIILSLMLRESTGVRLRSSLASFRPAMKKPDTRQKEMKLW